VVGYGFIDLPLEAGTHDLHIRTWEPEGSVRAQMRRFFVGGAPALQDKKLSGIPEDYKYNFLSKYGFMTRNSGFLHIRLNIVKTVHEKRVSLKDVDDGNMWKAALRNVAKRSKEKNAAAASPGKSMFKGNLRSRWLAAKANVKDLVNVSHDAD